MWEKIKNFFKWVGRKISSGWNWLFGGKANATQQNTSQHEERSDNEKQEPAQANDQSKDHTTPKTLDNEVNPDQSIPPAAPDEPQRPVINTSETDAKELPENFPTPNPKNADSDVLKEASNENYLKVGGKGLLLVLTSEQFAKCKDYKDSQSTSPGGLLMYIKCGENEYCITGANNDNLPYTICIKSILKKSKDGKYVNGNIVLVEEGIKHVKKMLELNHDGVVKVDSISNEPFEAPTLEQPNSNGTSHNVTQQVVNNDSNETEVKQASGSTTAGLTELPGVNSTQELSTPSNETVKIDTPDQPKSPAVPNEPQETLVNAHEEKGKPNNTASNGKVQLGVSNEEVDEVLAKDSGKTEEIPSSEKSKRESSTINVFNRNLELRLADDIQQKLEDYKHPENNGKYRMEIHCSKGNFNINFIKKDKDDGSVSLLINMLQKTGDKQVLSDTSKIKKSLGFEKGSTFVVIDSIQKYQPSAKPDGQAQGSGDEPNQSSFDNESVKDDDKEADNPQPEISANGSAPTDSSSFDIVSSQATTPDELQEPDGDKELARQSEANQKAPANDDGPDSLVATPEVQTASNDKTK